jgi:zinc/manganese transport system substrate-binding protein
LEKKMKKIIVILLAISGFGAHSALSKINVVASTSDLASIAQFIGGDHINVKYIVDGRSDPHFVEVLPSYMIMVSRANLYLKVGLGLDFWANPIIDGSRNGKVTVIDCSEGVDVLNKPTLKVNASMGDVHPYGNPHYQLDPADGLIMARNIEAGLEQVDPADAPAYKAGLKAFDDKMQTKLAEWQKEAEPLKGLQIVTYHDSWPYFSRAFGVEVMGFIEPKPGIEPTASHTADIIDLIKKRNIKVIGKEPYFSDKAPNSIAVATGAKVVAMPQSVGGAPGVDDYFALFDTLLARLNSVAGGKP